MIANLAAVSKGGIALFIAGLVLWFGMAVKAWRIGYVENGENKPALVAMTAERDDLAKQILGVTIENNALKLAIADQNAALALAEEKTRSAEAQQAQARAYADGLAKQKDKRIRELEAELSDPTKTVSDVLDSHWRRHAN